MQLRLVILIFCIIVISLSSLAVAGEEGGVLIEKNNKASRAIKLIEEAKRLLSVEGDKAEIGYLSLIQRNIARRHIVLNLYTTDIEAEILKYLGGNVYQRIGTNATPVKIKQRRKKGKVPIEGPESKDNNLEELEKLQRKLLNNARQNN